MRWTIEYTSDADGEDKQAVVEARSSAEAVRRLREVIGNRAGVLFVRQDDATPSFEATYEDFLTDPRVG